MNNSNNPPQPRPRQNLRDLFRETQALPVARDLTERDVAREVEDMRSGHRSRSRGAGAPGDG